MQTVSRAEKIADEQTDAKRKRADYLEIDESLEENATELLQVADLGQAEHDRAEDDRPYHDAQQRNEGIAERLHGARPIGRHKAKNDS
jgi:hypothetical protein